MTNQMVREAFTKAHDYKWMAAEDGGIFEGPSGKHSERIGEIKIGDVVKADAETFDPDNKIIWRLKDTLEGGWIYAPVRGPKTLVPMNEELLDKIADTENGNQFAKWYKIGGRKGTIVREEKEMDSDKVKVIESDSIVCVREEATLDDGKVRMRIDAIATGNSVDDTPLEGWITKNDKVEIWYKELPRSAFKKK